MSSNKTTKAVLKNGVYIMPRAAAPTLAGRPKPAPAPGK